MYFVAPALSLQNNENHISHIIWPIILSINCSFRFLFFRPIVFMAVLWYECKSDYMNILAQVFIKASAWRMITRSFYLISSLSINLFSLRINFFWMITSTNLASIVLSTQTFIKPIHNSITLDVEPDMPISNYSNVTPEIRVLCIFIDIKNVI